MAGVNKAVIIGRLGKDPEVRHFDNGGIVANFTVATSEKWTDKSTGEIKEQTEWHQISIWGKKAELAEKYLSKGSEVYLEGMLKTRSWEKDGITRYTTEIVLKDFVGDMQFIGSKPSDSSSRGPQEQPLNDVSAPDDGDSLPF